MTDEGRRRLKERVLLLAPTARDATTTQSVLGNVGVESAACATIPALCEELARGAGALILTEHASASGDVGMLVDYLRRQPPWSDLPVLVLAAGGAESAAGRRAMEQFGNVTVLERPVQMASLASVVRTLIRSRQRQYQIRQHLLERERAADELRRSEAAFRELADAMPQIVWAARPDGHLDYFNRRWYEFTGMPEGAGGDAGWAHVLHPDDLRPCLDAWYAAVASGDRYQIEYRFRDRRTGEYRWHLGRALPVRDAAGAVVRWYGTCTDIDDQKRAEESLKLQARVLESMSEGVSVCDEDGVILYTNPAEDRMFGYGPGELVGKHVSVQNTYAPEENARIVADVIAELKRTGAWFGEFSNQRKDGTAFTTFAHITALEVAGRRHWVCVQRDVTESKRAEKEREALLASERAARSEAERVGRVKDEFLATLSHELRTPLNAILGWSQLLRAGRRDEAELAEGLESIARNAQAQTQIIEDLLDMSRIISGKIRLDVRRVDLPAVIAAALDTVRPAVEAKGIRVQTVLDPAAGPISGDPDRLQQVFWNLLSNAVKFTPAGGRVQVALGRVGSQVQVRVSDTGEGIRPEFLPHVFDRFRQEDASTTRRHGGLGLGLAIVKQLVELHGGTIRAESPGPGLGATFLVTLPLTSQPPDEAPRPRHASKAPAHPLQARPRPTLRGVKVLVVDDEPDARTLVRRVLEECHAAVSTAGSAGEALDLVRQDPPDVLVSDIAMPGEDGYALMRKLRALLNGHSKLIPAVALTAYARPEDRTKAIESGFQLHVAKPVEPDELVTIVATLAGRSGDAGTERRRRAAQDGDA